MPRWPTVPQLYSWYTMLGDRLPAIKHKTHPVVYVVSLLFRAF